MTLEINFLQYSASIKSLNTSTIVLFLSTMAVSMTFLMALAMAGTLSTSLALHALTIGGIGSMTIGMMVRVSMGHSGRELYAPALMASAFVAMNLAVVVRVFLPLVLPLESYPLLVLISALIWAISFSVFVVKMSPVYFLPRVDGRPGEWVFYSVLAHGCRASLFLSSFYFLFLN